MRERAISALRRTNDGGDGADNDGGANRGQAKSTLPPMAASSTESLALHVASVSSGNGLPVASIAAPPMSAVVNWNVCPSFLPASSSTLSATSVISGPMPSPGSTAILWLVDPTARATTRAERCCLSTRTTIGEDWAWRRAPAATGPAAADRRARKAMVGSVLCACN